MSDTILSTGRFSRIYTVLVKEGGAPERDRGDYKYLQVSDQLVATAGLVPSRESRIAVGFSEDVYYSHPNTATIIKWLERFEANPSQSKFVAAMRETIDAIRLAHAEFTVAKARHEAIKGAK